MRTVFAEYLRRLAPHWRTYQDHTPDKVRAAQGSPYEKLRLACERILSEMRREGIIKG